MSILVKNLKVGDVIERAPWNTKRGRVTRIARERGGNAQIVQIYLEGYRVPMNLHRMDKVQVR